KWRQAANTARDLVRAQEQFADASPESKMQALIESAEADMAHGDYDKAAESVRKAAELTQELDVEAAASAFVDMSTFYLPAGNKGFGADLLDAAIKALAAQTKKDSILYVRTAAKVGRGLGAYGRWRDAVGLLVPLVQAGERRLDTE